jgi:hypothetical protein
MWETEKDKTKGDKEIKETKVEKILGKDNPVIEI